MTDEALKYRDQNGEVWTQVNFADLSKEQILEAINEFNHFLVPLMAEGREHSKGTLILMDEDRDLRCADYTVYDPADDEADEEDEAAA